MKKIGEIIRGLVLRKKNVCWPLVFFITFSLFAQNEEKQNKYIRGIRLREVEVLAKRPMKDIGTQKTKLDTMVLHENISLSMAEVLTQNTTIFIKQYGRATLSTASFRGTSPSHTQVSWNGLKINSPMLGMVDFSMIPSFFIDEAALFHGSSSVSLLGGGLGGAINLSTKAIDHDGLGLQYVQGLASFKTFDEFVRLSYGGKRWKTSTRIVYSSSNNEYEYKNYNKKIKIYDNNYQPISSYYPTEKNKSGYFRDFNALQELYYNTSKGSRYAFLVWFLNSRRGVPMLNVDYKNNAEFHNEQNEQTLRSVFSWTKAGAKMKTGAKFGYVNTALSYDYSRDLGNGKKIDMIKSHSAVNSFYGAFDIEYYYNEKWLFLANIDVYQHFVRSEDKNIITQLGNKATVGYDQARVETTASISAKWKPTRRLGFSLVLREDMYGKSWAPIIPAFFSDYLLSEKGNLLLKSSVSRNFRFPTLNDLYFLPGGNLDLKREEGFTYDVGLSSSLGKTKNYRLKSELTWFDSYIKDWIVWLPNFKGFWTPQNVKKVHAYGIEAKTELELLFSNEWKLDLNALLGWTPSINQGEAVNWTDSAIGKQLVYIPKYSSAISGRLTYKSWSFLYKWTYYSERFTTSSNEMKTKISRISPYFMSNISFEKQFSFQWSDIAIKSYINNLFNEEYETVLSRPMPQINYGINFNIRPKLNLRKRVGIEN